MGKKLMVCGATSISIGIFLVACGIGLQWFIFPAVLEWAVYDQLDLREGTQGWDAWLEPPVPVYMCFNFLEVNNGPEVASGSAKPNVSEYGPYCFSEVRQKQDILEVGADGLHYSLYLAYNFDAEETARQGCVNCRANDTFTLLNALMAAVPQLLESSISPAGDTDVDKYLKAVLQDMDDAYEGTLTDGPCANGACVEELFMEYSVEDFLFKGFDSGTLRALKYSLKKNEGLLADALPPQIIINLIEAIFGPLPDLGGILDGIVDIIPEEFYFFLGRNGTKENQWFLINNGRYQHNNMLEIERFNGRDKLPDAWWEKVGPRPSATRAGMTGICHDIIGTDGTQYPPYIDKKITRWLFVPEMCRSIWLDYYQDAKVRGIKALEYRPEPNVFNMSYPNNFCYCPGFLECAGTDGDAYDNKPCRQCLDGMIRVSSCYGGVPVVMTAPHFFRGDLSLISAVDGMNPDPELHDTVLYIEPLSGVAMRAHKRIQINMDAKNSSYVKKLKNLEDVLFPILWADENAEVDDETADLFKLVVQGSEKLVLGISIGLGMVLGGILFVAGIGMCCYG